MSENCVFCQIIQKKSPACIVYEDEPKKHYENIYEIPEEEVAYLFKITKRVAHAVRDGISAKGIRIVQNNGRAAGQVIFHLHVHVIPLMPEEGFSHGKAYRNPTNERPRDSLEQDAEKIRHFL
jgi:histidine triad (HIT) family protein